jgi:hypothetical protein
MKSVEPIYQRVMQRWAIDEADARRYLRQLVLSQPQRLGTDAFLGRLRLPLAEFGRRVRQERREEVALTQRMREDGAKAMAQATAERIMARNSSNDQMSRKSAPMQLNPMRQQRRKDLCLRRFSPLQKPFEGAPGNSARSAVSVNRHILQQFSPRHLS